VVTDAGHGIELGLGNEEAVVEVYARLSEFLVDDGLSGVVARHESPIVHVRDNGNYLVRGVRVPDPAIRHRLAVPDHEDLTDIDTPRHV
jgi:hypothetical protein